MERDAIVNKNFQVGDLVREKFNRKIGLVTGVDENVCAEPVLYVLDAEDGRTRRWFANALVEVENA